jgi:hypothetical protein
MTPEQIAADIERGKEIKSQIAALVAELKQIENRLELAAERGEHLPLKDEGREGRQCLLRSPRYVLPVRFTADSIVASFPFDGPLHKRLAELTGEKLTLLFKEERGFKRLGKDGKAWRELARTNLDPETFALVVEAATQRDKAGIAKSTVQIAWDETKDPAAVVDGEEVA